ncbi:PaaI family thioesterase [Corallincola platygyrae]|uniref:Acyl-coenzyme A thioesterase THEM4 n=1 Tax=Corallincola platygyrae TaxID=1193278 RepID=A0ABW4XHL6_9GAMM
MGLPSLPSYEQLKTTHRQCIACGQPAGEQKGLELVFRSFDEGVVRATFYASESHQGYQGLMHGGLVATLLDAAMTHCLFYAGVKALTAELQVRYLSPVVLPVELTVEARRTKQRRGIHWLEAKVYGADVTYANASAKFVSVAGM